MIGRFLESLTDEQLQRVADAQAWDNTYGIHDSADCPRCLLSHAYGTYGAAGTSDRRDKAAEDRYMAMRERFGVISPRWSLDWFTARTAAPIVRMIQDRARRILASRTLANQPPWHADCAQPDCPKAATHRVLGTGRFCDEHASWHDSTIIFALND